MSSFSRVYIALPDIIDLLQTKYFVRVLYKNENKIMTYKICNIHEDYFDIFRTNVFEKTTYENEILKLLLEYDITPHYKFMAQLQVHYDFYS